MKNWLDYNAYIYFNIKTNSIVKFKILPEIQWFKKNLDIWKFQIGTPCKSTLYFEVALTRIWNNYPVSLYRIMKFNGESLELTTGIVRQQVIDDCVDTSVQFDGGSFVEVVALIRPPIARHNYALILAILVVTLGAPLVVNVQSKCLQPRENPFEMVSEQVVVRCECSS